MPIARNATLSVLPTQAERWQEFLLTRKGRDAPMLLRKWLREAARKVTGDGLAGQRVVWYGARARDLCSCTNGCERRFARSEQSALQILVHVARERGDGLQILVPVGRAAAACRCRSQAPVYRLARPRRPFHSTLEMPMCALQENVPQVRSFKPGSISAAELRALADSLRRQSPAAAYRHTALLQLAEAAAAALEGPHTGELCMHAKERAVWQALAAVAVFMCGTAQPFAALRLPALPCTSLSLPPSQSAH